MTVRRRLERLEEGVPVIRPDAPDITPQQLIAVTRSRAWTLDDWRIVFGEGQIEEARNQVIIDARVARQRREAGHDPSLGIPTAVAAEILSHRPEEEVPPTYAGLIDKHFQDPPPPALVAYLVHAAMAALVLGSTDGMALRRHIWERGHPLTTDDIG